MIDKETGRITVRDDLIIYPGMTKEEFIESKLFDEVIPAHRDTKRDDFFRLKPQIIEGNPIRFDLFFSGSGIIRRVDIFHDDLNKWREWHGNEDIMLKKFHDRIIETDFGIKVKNVEKEADIRCD